MITQSTSQEKATENIQKYVDENTFRDDQQNLEFERIESVIEMPSFDDNDITSVYLLTEGYD